MELTLNFAQYNRSFILVKGGIKMIYGYIRVSTDKQTVENQRFEIERFALSEKMKVNSWIEETISGTKDYEKRLLGKKMKKMVSGDIVICSELSRLGRSLFMIMDILNECMKLGYKVISIKDNYRLGDDIQSKVLAFAFGLSAEIERNLISQRTKEALARKKKEGVVLGRPKGRTSAKVKLSDDKEKIILWIHQGKRKSWISRKLKVHRNTLDSFIKKRIEKDKLKCC